MLWKCCDLKNESGWRDYGLMTASSLLHFMYLKWVNIPQDNDRPKVTEDLSLDLEMLRPHHEFLFRNFVGDFVTKGVYELSITENSVYFSEAFAFVSFCHLYQVDFIAESGVYKGVSTEIWSLFAKEVAAIDLAISVEAESRLRPRRNVKLYAGGRAEMPALLSERPERHAAVFVDGPKGELAIHLALSLCERPEVAFVAIHDMGPYKRELKRLGAFFFSDEEWFQATYGHLDSPFQQRPDLEGGGITFVAMVVKASSQDGVVPNLLTTSDIGIPWIWKLWLRLQMMPLIMRLKKQKLSQASRMKWIGLLMTKLRNSLAMMSEIDMEKRLMHLRKAWVEEKEKFIVFGNGKSWADIEADETTFTNADFKDLAEDPKKPVGWEQWYGLVPDTLLLKRLFPLMSAKPAPDPGAIRNVEWKSLAHKHLQNRRGILTLMPPSPIACVCLVSFMTISNIARRESK
ncbi:Hypothetical protein SCF082_LOCUS34708 [Durusdinium trenchii]|uniref:Uncharacterized protein n=1 Tax=Durusdinium trenchii TaxID=1381693 RepID=A0ABP0NZL1_9DINO